MKPQRDFMFPTSSRPLGDTHSLSSAIKRISVEKFKQPSLEQLYTLISLILSCRIVWMSLKLLYLIR